MKAKPIIDLRTHEEIWVTPEELAQYWRVNYDTVIRDIKKGALRAYQVGSAGQHRIHIHDARAYGKPTDAPVEETVEQRARRFELVRGATTFLTPKASDTEARSVPQ